MKENKYPKKVTIRVAQDQYDFLEKLDNASEWMRNAIDNKMFEETSDVLAIVRRIQYLEKEKQRIYNSEEYQTAKDMVNVNFAELRRNLIGEEREKTGGTPFLFNYENKKITCTFYRSSRLEFIPVLSELVTQTDLQDFINENNLQPLKDYDREVAVKLFKKIEDKLAYMRSVHEKYNRKIAEIQAEINSLKNKMKKDSFESSLSSIKKTKK